MGRETRYTESWFKERLQKKRRVRPPSDGIYHWIFTVKDGRNVCLGYQPSEIEAIQYCYTNNIYPYEIVPSKYKDKSRVIQDKKGEILNEKHDLDEALVRFKRKL
jgi:hypothetical protein